MGVHSLQAAAIDQKYVYETVKHKAKVASSCAAVAEGWREVTVTRHCLIQVISRLEMRLAYNNERISVTHQRE